MDFFRRCYEGEVELWKAFWFACIGGSLGLFGILASIVMLMGGTVIGHLVNIVIGPLLLVGFNIWDLGSHGTLAVRAKL